MELKKSFASGYSEKSTKHFLWYVKNENEHTNKSRISLNETATSEKMKKKTSSIAQKNNNNNIANDK